MKLLVAGYGNQRLTKTWSGTPHKIIELLEKKGIEVDDYDLSTPISPIKNIFLKLYGKILYYKNFARSPFLAKQCSKSLEKEIEKRKISNLLFIAESIFIQNLNVNVNIYTDALLKPLLKYEPAKSQISKIGFSHFYQAYEHNDILSYQRANHIFTQNEWSRDFLIQEYGIESSKIYNVGFGVNLTPLTEPKSYDNNLLLIILRKGTEKLKGLYLLLEAFRLLRQQITDIRLAIVGTDGEPEIGVTYYYNQPRSQTVKLLKECTLYVMPALSEPNGITYLEALANKSPIIGLNRFAFPEFAGYGKYGFICNDESPKELAETIKKAIGNKQKLFEMGIAGQKYVLERYSWEIVIEKMLQYMSLK